jgi:glucose-6-phosphate 1-dehydrogenase
MDVQHRAHASGARKAATPWRGDVGTPDDHVIVLFGATGDLARRKLLPGLFRLAKAGLMPASYRIIGSGRSQLTDDEFRRLAKEAVNDFGAENRSPMRGEFALAVLRDGRADGRAPLLDAVAG